MNQKKRRILSALIIACVLAAEGNYTFAGEMFENEQWGKYYYSGRDFFQKGHYLEAEKQFSLSLRETQRIDPQNPSARHGSQNESLAWLAKACLRQGKLQQAESLSKQALKISESSTDQNYFDIGERITDVSEVYRLERKFRDAESLDRRALALYEKHFEEDLSKNDSWTGVTLLAAVLINLGLLLQEQNKDAEAEVFIKRALRLEEHPLGPNDPENQDLILDINMQASIYHKEKRGRDFEASLQKSIGETRSTPDVVIRLNNLAALYFAEGKYDKAEPLVKDALGKSQILLGTVHPTLANIRKNLGEVYMAEGKYKDAEPLLKSALEMSEKSLGVNHPAVANILDNYAALLRKTNRKAEAEKMEARAKLIRTPQ
jgi:tetratricopeptide (TPR) repeat protein